MNTHVRDFGYVDLEWLTHFLGGPSSPSLVRRRGEIGNTCVLADPEMDVAWNRRIERMTVCPGAADRGRVYLDRFGLVRLCCQTVVPNRAKMFL
jgi:hypothetical protein